MVNLIWWNKNWGFELISLSFNKHFSDHLLLLKALLSWASCFFGILNKGATVVSRKGDQEHRRDIKGVSPNLQLINDKVCCYKGSESVAGMPHTKRSDPEHVMMMSCSMVSLGSLSPTQLLTSIFLHSLCFLVELGAKLSGPSRSHSIQTNCNLKPWGS